MYTTQSGSPKKANPPLKEYCVAPTLRNTYLQNFDDMCFTHTKPPCGNHTLWYRDSITPPPPHVPCTQPLLSRQGTHFQGTIISCLNCHTDLLAGLWLPHYSHSLSLLSTRCGLRLKCSSLTSFWPLLILPILARGDFASLAYLKFPNYSPVPSPI